MPPGDRTRDHVITRADGGTNELGNLRLAHAQCNVDRGNWDGGGVARLEAELMARVDAVGELFRRVAREEVEYVVEQAQTTRPMRWDREIPMSPGPVSMITR